MAESCEGRRHGGEEEREAADGGTHEHAGGGSHLETGERGGGGHQRVSETPGEEEGRGKEPDGIVEAAPEGEQGYGGVGPTKHLG